MTRAIATPLRALLSVSASIAAALTAGRAVAGSPGCAGRLSHHQDSNNLTGTP